ncbi:NAD(P)-binding protein [Epithele typhae]|uniref:NAD(P)-binding protein n=1 Tax=Epithele typhae TaxID=378194 RepID=UPI002008E5AD|nr:NAD(P)-binding protein [Epithele typhae]KAH9932017.1 NAD(P)-binding protein [Epithele typhae]
MGALLSLVFNVYSFASLLYPPSPRFSVDDIPDLGGQVVIVTGGYAGIGKETVKALLQRNAKVYVAGRDKSKAASVLADLAATTGNEPLFLELDLASLKSVKHAADEFMSKERELHMLFNNAGVMYPPRELVTVDGYDLQFGTNVIGHFYLTELLTPALIAGKDSAKDHHARVITTSSGGAYFGSLNWDTFKDGPVRRGMWMPGDLYTQSKLANVVVAREVAKRYAKDGIISVSVNPGNIKSELQRHVPAVVQRVLATLILYPTPYGALTQLWAGTMPEVLNYNGEYLVPWARLGRCKVEAYDPVIGERLWAWLKEQVKGVTVSEP